MVEESPDHFQTIRSSFAHGSNEARVHPWVSWRPQEKTNPLVIEFKKTLDRMRGLTTVFTFNGLCFWDDKYPDHIASERLKRSLSMTLPKLSGLVGDSKWVYLTIQPSDDIYCVNAVESLHSVKPEEKAIGWKKGYVMNYATKEVAEYNPDTLPPFTTIIFPTETFLDPIKHYKYIGPYKSHEYVKDHLKLETLEGRGFMVGTHGYNISTTYVHPYRGRILKEDEQERVWLDFACWDADPIPPQKKRFGLVLRIIVNSFPKPLHDFVRRNYYAFFKGS